MKPERWYHPAKNIFTHQVGCMAPPHDFLKIAPEGVGAHGRLIHIEEYQHQLSQQGAQPHLLACP